jgi:hypothetical protein
LGLVWLAESMIIVERLTETSEQFLRIPASSGFIARLDFGELARWGRVDSGLSELALALLVLRVLANHANNTATVNHLALVADRLY